MRPFASLLVALLALGPLASAYLHTSGRWIVNEHGQRVKLRCVNWAGHLETGIPEGFHLNSPNSLAEWVASSGFNCVRLSYSTDMVVHNADTLVSASFYGLAGRTGLMELLTIYRNIIACDPELGNISVRGAYKYLIDALTGMGMYVVLDNHVSQPGWCCNQVDGNGWFNDTSSVQSTANDGHFDTNEWILGLETMAQWTMAFNNPQMVVGMSVRNELRPIYGLQDINHDEWHAYVTRGAEAIQRYNPNLLIIIGGVTRPGTVTGARDLSFLQQKALDTSSWPNRTVWEAHTFAFDPDYPTDCPSYWAQLDASAGFALQEHQPWTGPLWISEFGFDLSPGHPTPSERAQMTCLAGWLDHSDIDWAMWALQPAYYLREGIVSYNETFSLVDQSNWGLQPIVMEVMGDLFNQTQGPPAAPSLLNLGW